MKKIIITALGLGLAGTLLAQGGWFQRTSARPQAEPLRPPAMQYHMKHRCQPGMAPQRYGYPPFRGAPQVRQQSFANPRNKMLMKKIITIRRETDPAKKAEMTAALRTKMKARVDRQIDAMLAAPQHRKPACNTTCPCR
ncbi:MAG: hypothetical protein WC959_11430 [Kiritimatiellales bacterium]